MHFFGGMTAFYIAAAVLFPFFRTQPLPRYLRLSILCALLIGVAWEAFELVLFVKFAFPPFHILDSLSDVCFDLAGILLAAYMTLRARV